MIKRFILDSTKTVRVINEVFYGFRRYLFLLAFTGVLSASIDGVTIAAIIPLVSFFLSSGAGLPTSAITNVFIQVFAILHVPFEFRYLLLFVAFLLLSRMLVQGTFAYLRSRVNSRFFGKEVERLHALTLSASWPFIVRQKAGHLQSSILWDVRRVNDLLDTVVQFAQSGTGLMIYTLVALSISPLTTLVTGIAGVLLLILLRPLLSKTRAFGESMRTAENELTQHIGEHIGGFKQLKAAQATDGAIASAATDIRKLEHALGRSILASSIGSIFVQPFGFLFAMVLFSIAYLTHTFHLAEFAATLYLIQKIFTYMESSQASLNVMLRSVPFAEHVLAYTRELNDAQEYIPENPRPFAFAKEVTYDNVSFAYADDTPALSNISFTIPKGSFTAIVGPSGAGKTSVIDLFLQLFVPASGGIRIDGVPIREIPLSVWRKRIGYVSQDAFLIHASVRDNIRFYDSSISDEVLEEAARTAAIYDDIMRLPEGFDTMLGERGATLSGGQRQRIALARALARAPEILILDEATSALDSETAARIQEVIERLHGQMTLVVIAHRISSVLAADQLLVLEQGKLMAAGSPEEMRKDPDSYLSRMLRMQGSGE